jgi:hypothetical protein
LVSLPKIKQSGESNGESDPHRRPTQRFSEPDSMAWAMERTQVEHQHAQRE